MENLQSCASWEADFILWNVQGDIVRLARDACLVKFLSTSWSCLTMIIFHIKYWFRETEHIQLLLIFEWKQNRCSPDVSK